MKITKLPETAYEVISILSTRNLLSLEEINDLIEHRDRKTIKYAIRRLQENDILQIEPNLLDMRSSTYRLSTEEEIKVAEEKIELQLLNNILDYIHGQGITDQHPIITPNMTS